MNEKKKVMILLAIVLVIVAVIISSFVINNIKSNNLYKQFESAFKSNENKLIMLGRPDCGYCQAFKPILDGYVDKYNFKYLYVNINELTSNDFNKVLDQLGVDANDFGTPYTIVAKDGKVVAVQSGMVAQDKDLFDFLQKKGFISADTEYTSSSNLTYITAAKFVDLVKASERSVIVIGQTTCIHCTNARPVLSEIVADEGIVINYIDYNTLTADDQNLVLNSLDYLKNTEWGTPLMLVVENNKLVNNYAGEATKSVYTNFLKENGVIK